MDKTKIDRINELARKSRIEELTDDEKWEQKMLRQEYLAAIRGNLETTLEQTYIMDEHGNKTKLQKKNCHDENCRCSHHQHLH